ncbi:MAG TPA: hypothetical protein VIF62_30305 [Labilithrix sp.]
MPALRMLDDELGFDAANDDLDIPLLDETPRPAKYDLPKVAIVGGPGIRRKSSGGMPAVRHSSGAMNAVHPSSGGMPAAHSPLRTTGSAMNAVDPHAVYVAFAKFGDPPATIWQSPRYAVHVMRRKRTLERELECARRRGSHDVALYEAALRTADTGSVRAGIALMCAAVSLLPLFGIALFQVLRGALHL